MDEGTEYILVCTEYLYYIIHPPPPLAHGAATQLNNFHCVKLFQTSVVRSFRPTWHPADTSVLHRAATMNI